MPDNVCRIIQVLNNAGFEAYAVGGCVRDTLLSRVPLDWDITTSAKPEQVKALFRRTIDTGIQHGTVTVMFGKDGYEVTTYRIDGEYEDGRHPKEVTFTNNLVEDLKRRDFTINAMAYNGTEIVDEFEGLQDLEKGIIRAVGNAEERFTEDALRILRALRFSAQLNYEIEPDTVKAIIKLKDNLKQISAERIRVELTKLLMSGHPQKLTDVYNYGVTEVVLPIYNAYSDDERSKIIEALTYSVKAGRIVSFGNVESNFESSSPDDNENIKSEEYLRFSILLMYAGAEKAKQVLRELKFDNETIRCVTTLVENIDNKPVLNDADIRRSIVRVGTDLVPVLIKLWRMTTPKENGNSDKYIDYIDEYENHVNKILDRGDCICMKNLALTGRDIIDELNMKPGKELGEVLNYLFNKVLDEPGLNSRDALLESAKEYVRNILGK